MNQIEADKEFIYKKWQELENSSAINLFVVQIFRADTFINKILNEATKQNDLSKSETLGPFA